MNNPPYTRFDNSSGRVLMGDLLHTFAFAPRAGGHSRNTSNATSQSASVIFVDIAEPQIASTLCEEDKSPLKS